MFKFIVFVQSLCKIDLLYPIFGALHEENDARKDYSLKNKNRFSFKKKKTEKLTKKPIKP